MRIRKQPRLDDSGSMFLPMLASVAESKTLFPSENGKGRDPDDFEDTMIYSASKFRASINWLNKLRAAKGFPVEPDLRIEDFLTSRDSLSPRESQVGSPAIHGGCYSHFGKLDQDSAKTLSSRTPTTEKHRNASSEDRPGKSEEVAVFKTRDFDKDNDVLHRATSHTNFYSTADLNCRYGSSIKTPSAFTTSPGKHTVKAVLKHTVKAVSDESNFTEETSSADASIESCLHSEQGLQKLGNSQMSTDGTSQEIGTSGPQLSTNVFADLFCMDDSYTADEKTNGQGAGSVKRHKRKQEKPRICPTSSDSEPPAAITTSSQLLVIEVDTNPLDAANQTLQSEEIAWKTIDSPSSSQEKQVVDETLMEQKDMHPSAVNSSEWKDNSESPLNSRNEIFVIDTSLRGWRVEKVIIRRGSSWKVKDNKCTVPSSGNVKTTANVSRSKKRARTPHFAQLRTEKSHSNRFNRNWQCDSNSSVEKGENHAGESAMVSEAWRTVPQTQLRSCRKRRKSAGSEGAMAISKKNHPCQDKPIEAEVVVEQKDTTTSLAPDHPANQPKETLIFSIYQVFLQAGKAGLTAREAVSRVLERGLPGLHEGGVVPRVEVLKIISNSPYFMLLEESKYILCSALVGDEGHSAGRENGVQEAQQNQHEEAKESLDSVKRTKQRGISQYWAACAAIRRARTGKTRRKPSSGSCTFNPAPTQEIGEAIPGLSRKKRLKSVKQEVTGLGNPCNRSDGKGWHCPLRAKVGYLLCDHHLDRLRVKSHLKSKMFSINKPSTEERKRTYGDSWMVKKVVERSRIGRHSQVAVEREAQNKVRASTPFEALPSKDFFNLERA